MGVVSSKLLQVHHEPTIASYASAAFLIDKVVYGFQKLFFDLGAEVVLLTSFEGETRHNAVVHVIIEGVWVVNITKSRWVIVVVKADDADGWRKSTSLARTNRCASISRAD